MDPQNSLLLLVGLDLPLSPLPVGDEPKQGGTVALLQAQSEWIARVGITPIPSPVKKEPENNPVP
jgi:hypothetical protein